jgi:hypothetical protein
MLKAEPDVEVSLVDGKRGELTVSVNDHVVAKKRWFLSPDPAKVVFAVKQAPG